MDIVLVVTSVVLGTVLSSVLSVLPGLHVFNVMGLMIMGMLKLQEMGHAVPSVVYLPFMMGLVVGWAMLNTIPAVLLGAPDESALFTVLPGQKYLMTGRGYEGTMLTAVGGLGGVFLLVLVGGPLAPKVLPVIQEVIQPHVHWILWVIVTYILMAEWPKGGTTGVAGWKKFLDAWRSLGVGLITFLLSGLLGFIIFYRPVVSVDVAFQNIMPAFVGLFAVPWCLLNIVSAADVPKQHISPSMDLSPGVLIKSIGAGGLGGGFAAFVPVVTGGIGGMLAGHATAQRDERIFIMSQGVSKLVYYVGGFMLLFVPGLGLRRGGAAWMVQTLHVPQTWYEYFMILASIAIAGGVSFLMVGPLARQTLRIIGRFDYRHVSSVALAIIVAIVVLVTGWGGVLLMTVATGIGLLPVLFGSRRLNCLGILLLPIGCNMSGFGTTIAGWLGLL